MRKARLAALALPLLLLLPGAAPVAAQDTECDITIGLFDGTETGCDGTSLTSDDPTQAEALKAAQASWDAFAARTSKAFATLWLGPRPTKVADIWWISAP